MEGKDIITFEEYPDGRTKIYIEDAVGHHAAIFLKKDQLREYLESIPLFENTEECVEVQVEKYKKNRFVPVENISSPFGWYVGFNHYDPEHEEDAFYVHGDIAMDVVGELKAIDECKFLDKDGNTLIQNVNFKRVLRMLGVKNREAELLKLSNKGVDVADELKELSQEKNDFCHRYIETGEWA